MPGTGIHLLIAHALAPDASGMFFFGSYAPDFEQERVPKNRIHLRDEANRLEALTALRDSVDMEDDFARGWILHLFTDLLWDESLLAQYRYDYTSGDESREDWFFPYRAEIGLTTGYLYNSQPWMDDVHAKTRAAGIAALRTSLPVDMEKLLWWKERVHQKYTDRTMDVALHYYTMPMLNAFTERVTKAWREWD